MATLALSLKDRQDVLVESGVSCTHRDTSHQDAHRQDDERLFRHGPPLLFSHGQLTL